jgi:hypothetical protein
METLADHTKKRRKLVPLSHIRAIYEHGTLGRADLVFKKGGYSLFLHTESDVLCVARRDGDQARSWRSVDRALSFIKLQFGIIETILLIHPPGRKPK